MVCLIAGFNIRYDHDHFWGWTICFIAKSNVHYETVTFGLDISKEVSLIAEMSVTANIYKAQAMRAFLSKYSHTSMFGNASKEDAAVQQEKWGCRILLGLARVRFCWVQYDCAINEVMLEKVDSVMELVAKYYELLALRDSA